VIGFIAESKSRQRCLPLRSSSTDEGRSFDERRIYALTFSTSCARSSKTFLEPRGEKMEISVNKRLLTGMYVGVLLHVALLVESLAAELAGIRPRVRVD